MRVCIRLLVATAFLLSAMTSESRSLEVYPSTVTPPPFVLKDLSGQKHSLKQYKGRVVLVNFWGTWCPACIEELPSLQRLERQYTEKGLTVLAVNVNQTHTSVKRFLNGMGLDLTVLMDTSAITAKSWSVDYYPSSFVIDKQGLVRFFIIGAVDWEKAEVIESIDKLIKE